MMSIFNKSVNTDEQAQKPRKKKACAPKPPSIVSQDELDQIANEFDFSDLEPRLALFAKYYIAYNGVASHALRASGLTNVNCTPNTCRVLASGYLSRLRQHPKFWDMLHLGYHDLSELADKLKPDKKADIILKVHNDLIERVDSNVTVTIAKELDEDFK